ncbi:hypothetical protein SAMN05661080_02069 [Modestobacter sp. DSM 44400]|uniref:SCO7613 C-terminal domain-containing membrane protein n=1 Tax=Modestobacter sp. DSM 44400 TaxID=1550230 RepID=UPI00089D1A8F|nr:hypothetical protein [Modestobacter sp. DSM 44400]SDY02765.1 hypothetical protein SAMN05661080_02069 [Modestobacter sp. DSM 44400]
MGHDPHVAYPPPLDRPLPPPPAPPEAGTGPGRVSPQSVLLGAGAVAVVAAGAASLTAGGGGAGRLGVAALAVAAAAVSLRTGRRGLRTTEEVLAATAAVLALVAACSPDQAPRSPVLAGLAVAFLAVGRVGRTAAGWPVAAWAAAQLAVLVALPGLGLAPVVHAGAVLGTALAGLVVVLVARPPVAVATLVSTAPWWVIGVAEGQRLVWSDALDALPRAGAAALLVGVAAGLLATRRRASLRPLLGPRPAAPLLSGLAAGAGVAGALSAADPLGVPASGYLGLALAAGVAELAAPGRNSVLRPAGLTAAGTLTGLAVGQLLAGGRWPALALLLFVAALPALLVAARQPADRSGALPVAVGCLAGATLLADAGQVVTPGQTGWLLVALAVASLGVTTLLRGQHPELPLATAGTVVGGLGLLVPSDWSTAAAPLAVLGAALTGYAARAGRRGVRAAGCAALVAAAWLAVASAGPHVVEGWSLPAAAGLLLFSGRRLVDAPSWPAWGPALLTGFVPSVALAGTEPGTVRLLLVVAAATLTTTAATNWGVQAPFVVGAGALVVVAVGRVVEALPRSGLVAVAVAGALLLAVGASYESRRRQAVDAVGRVADMR